MRVKDARVGRLYLVVSGIANAVLWSTVSNDVLLFCVKPGEFLSDRGILTCLHPWTVLEEQA